MPIYDIRFKPSVEKDLRRLPGQVVQRIMERIEALGAAPLGRGATAMRTVVKCPPAPRREARDSVCYTCLWHKVG